MTEKYFELNYYKEIIGYIVMSIILGISVVLILIGVIKQKIDEWFRNRRERK